MDDSQDRGMLIEQRRWREPKAFSDSVVSNSLLVEIGNREERTCSDIGIV